MLLCLTPCASCFVSLCASVCLALFKTKAFCMFNNKRYLSGDNLLGFILIQGSDGDIISWYICSFFMEKQVLREFVRILKISKTITVSLQLLQTMSIIIQNLRNEHAICKMSQRRMSSLCAFLIYFMEINNILFCFCRFSL